MRAAFSAAVVEAHYANDAAMADLRRDYPALFSANRKSNTADDSPAAFTENEWLSAMGWRPDLAPFRPALQLLEPDELEDEWRLRLVLQDKQDSTLLTPIRLHVDGTASGAWASEWSPFVVERAPGWVTRLLEALPRMADDGELLCSSDER